MHLLWFSCYNAVTLMLINDSISLLAHSPITTIRRLTVIIHINTVRIDYGLPPESSGVLFCLCSSVDGKCGECYWKILCSVSAVYQAYEGACCSGICGFIKQHEVGLAGRYWVGFQDISRQGSRGATILLRCFFFHSSPQVYLLLQIVSLFTFVPNAPQSALEAA